MSQHDSHLDGAEFLKEETKGLYEPVGFPALAESAERSSKHNREITDAIPYFQGWREAANCIKRHAVANLDKLLIQFEQKMTAKGATVLWANDAAQANRYALDIAREHNVRSVVKSKSMVSEELELNHVLEAAGIRPIETDLGEYIVQLARQRPIHIVTPAIHMSAADVGNLFAETLGEPFSAEHRNLTDIARRHLREEYLKAGMGMSGGNFIIADTGTLVVIENEGNAGLSTATPPVHVALVGIEKVLPRIDHLPVFLNLLARSGTGQKLTTYTHLIHGPAPGKKLYIILIDNGRSNVLKDPAAWASLFCIRCGACLNACPVYRRTGGWAYGWVYPGPIGAILTPHLIGLDKAGTLPFASSLCGACGEVCPVKIDIPHQLVHLRHRAVVEPSPMNSFSERWTWRIWAWLMSGPKRYRLTMWGVRLGVRIARFLPWHPGKLGAWTRGRELPKVPGPAFRTWWRRNRVQGSGSRGQGPGSRDQERGARDKGAAIHCRVGAMNSREAVLQRIHSALSQAATAGHGAGAGGLTAAPPVPEVWPRTDPSPAAMAQRFADELKDVHGETIHCGSTDEARQRLVALMDEAKWPVIGAVDGGTTRELISLLPPDRVAWVNGDWPPTKIAELPAALVPAAALLADTGSCVITCPTAHERLMCYLPPACVVIGRTQQLAEHLPAAWEAMARQCGDPQARGELLIVTGPSRTADIEKILILGVHGPQRLVVLLAD